MDAKDIEQTSMPLISSLATTIIVAAIYARYSSDRQRDASIGNCSSRSVLGVVNECGTVVAGWA